MLVGILTKDSRRIGVIMSAHTQPIPKIFRGTAPKCQPLSTGNSRGSSGLPKKAIGRSRASMCIKDVRNLLQKCPQNMMSGAVRVALHRIKVISIANFHLRLRSRQWLPLHRISSVIMFNPWFNAKWQPIRCHPSLMKSRTFISWWSNGHNWAAFISPILAGCIPILGHNYWLTKPLGSKQTAWKAHALPAPAAELNLTSLRPVLNRSCTKPSEVDAENYIWFLSM